ncbi:growth arrest and DNA damage-inducible protein GADD45 alpha-like [Babylonia areolata]|uniref:growth arrest and DNA damage-inducible protein GADD45 alpha-like n=1 Tax=Babylonia areolata TaxID=304850 RepID=UPI003FD5323A
MPLPCVEEHEDEQHSHSEAVSRAVVEVVKQGMEEDRVTSGIQQCVQLMQSGPENLMLCLLVQLSQSLPAEIKIPLLLIRAFCQENDINLLHMKGENKLTHLMSTCLTLSSKLAADPVTKPPVQVNSDGLGCVMIKYPKHDTSFEDDMVADYIKEKMQNHTDPSVTIPDLTQTGVDKKLGFKLKTKMKTPIQASSQPTSYLSALLQ